MTNNEIIENASYELMANGIIDCARTIMGTNQDGEEVEIPIPEDIHTYAGWKALGRQVQKGQKSIATIRIWKYVAKKKKAEKKKDDSEETQGASMFLTNAYFFKECQTEPIQ